MSVSVPQIDPTDLTALVVDLARYQRFGDDEATVVPVCTTSQLPVVVWNLAPGQVNEAHVHESTEHVQIVIEGTCEFTLGDQPARLVGQGQAVIIPALVPHAVRNPTGERASYLAVSSPGPYVKVKLTEPLGG